VDRTEKRAFVQALQAVFADTSFVLVSQNKGLTVADATTLRRRMRDAGATYKVAKNRLAALALDGTSFQGITPLLKGPDALCVVRRIRWRWRRQPWNSPGRTTEFVVLGGRSRDPDAERRWREGPGRAALARDAACAAARPDPDAGDAIAGVLQAPGSQLARVFSAYAKKDEAGGA
jgi:large subunit ribosomal protein L10